MRTNFEIIERAEIPVQPVRERGDKMSACVPVHLGAAALPIEAKRGLLNIREATAVVSEWYNQDMDEYISALKNQGYDTSGLRGKEQFRTEWKLEARPTEAGTDFLELLLDAGEKLHLLRHDPIPVVLHNEHFLNEGFISPSLFSDRGLFPIIYRGILDPTYFTVTPEKLRFFGVESWDKGVGIDEEFGLAEVIGTTFNSEYYESVSTTILLRNFGVYYMNILIGEALSRRASE